MKFISSSGFILPIMLFITSALPAQDNNLLAEQGYIAKPAPEMEHICTLEPTYQNDHYFKQTDWEMLRKSQNQQAIDFQVDYEGGWPQEAIEAFEHALDIWSAHISSTVSVRIVANWTALSGNTLGSAGPTTIFQIPEGEPNTWYPIAQASAISGRDLVAESPGVTHDIRVSINSEFSTWYFGTDAETPEGQIDFVTVALHEIGHGLGFLGSVSADESDEIAQWGFSNDPDPPVPLIYDRFVIDEDAESILNENKYPNPSNELYRLVTGEFNGVFFSGEQASSTFQDLPIPLFSPDPWRQGSSYSHLDQLTFSNTENALMRPRIGSAFAMHSPGPVTCGMFSDASWPLSGGCLSLLGAESFITFNESDIDFGVTNAGTNLQETISISTNNDSPNSLVGRISITGSNGIFRIPGGVILLNLEPGEEIEIPVSFIPPGKGKFMAELRIEHNGSNLQTPLIVSLKGESLEEGKLVELEQNYPNPFNTSTIISYALPQDSNVRLDVYDQLGKLVLTLVNGTQSRGRHIQPLDANHLSSGMYFYRIMVEGASETGKMTLIK